MTKKETKYCGWTNYETWCVSLWIDNEEPSYRYWRDEALRHEREALQCSQVAEGIWTVDEAARFNLADQLKDEFNAGSPLREPSVYSDLLDSALAEVDWEEIAEHLTADQDGEPATKGRPAFSPGKIVIADRAFGTVSPNDIADALRRHIAGDWGDACEQDRRVNDRSLKDGSRLLSVYHTADETKFWIITEGDRSTTTVLLPEEY